LILRLEKLEPAAAPSEVPAVLRVPDVGVTGTESAPERPGSSTSLSRWSAAVAAAHDACFVLDATGAVVSISVAGVDLLGCGDETVIGRGILDVIHLVDLDTGSAHPEYASRITPLVVLGAPGLARSLMRVRHDDGTVVTLDSSSAPIHDALAQVLGSITFLARISSH
jgi:PAS domain S-box-containing protein